MGPKKITALVVGFVAFLSVLLGASSVVETNNEGFYQIKQAAVSGEITVRNDAGMYLQNLGKITTYQVSDMYYFSKSNLEGGKGEDSDPIPVRFTDGGTADITGFIKFKLSLKEEVQKLLHKEFKNYDSVVNDLIRQHVASALKQTASLMQAEETYSSRRAEFISLVEGQIIDGIYDTVSKVKKVQDATGKNFIQRITEVRLGSKGNPIVKTESPFKRYGIEVLSFNIKDIDFDETIDKLIAKKKEAQQKMVVAKAQAEEAKQNAITEAEKGKAAVAKAKAAQEVEKITEVTRAEKVKAVAELEAQKDFNVAKVEAQKEFDVAKLLAEKELEV
jgi:regulator of protease activity HflC (stomatin/prohibitin superfamily)